MRLLSHTLTSHCPVLCVRKVLVKQHRLQVLPGWNTKMLNTCNIVALSHGRAMLTTEKVQPKLEAYQKKMKEIERSGVSGHKQAKEVLRDMGQGLN